MINIGQTVELKENYFLQAWKKEIKTKTVDDAQDKWQVKPNFDFIHQTIGGYSRGQQAMLDLMYSFFNPEEGQQFLVQSNAANFVDALNLLDDDEKNIIVQLMLNHSGC